MKQGKLREIYCVVCETLDVSAAMQQRSSRRS